MKIICENIDHLISNLERHKVEIVSKEVNFTSENNILIEHEENLKFMKFIKIMENIKGIKKIFFNTKI